MSDWALAFFRLTRREYFADFFITPPVTIALACVSLYHSASVWWPPLFIAGVFAWTFYEYATHRWVAHRIWFFKQAHGLHHQHQKEYIAVHPLATIAAYVGFWLVLGFKSSAFMVGFSTGYIAYSVAHTLFHYATIVEGGWLFPAKRRHALHHRNDKVNFGVTTALWDVVFRTHRTSLARVRGIIPR
jgi:sterol desaturase/sphingolipid hydroxylase (fatty acid hydroxylase superfamily)